MNDMITSLLLLVVTGSIDFNLPLEMCSSSALEHMHALKTLILSCIKFLSLPYICRNAFLASLQRLS